MTVVLYVLGFIAIGLGFPVEGALGAALALVGMLLVWAGWYRAIRRGRDGAR